MDSFVKCLIFSLSEKKHCIGSEISSLTLHLLGNIKI